MALKTLFTEHPNSVGESYGEHLIAASSFGFCLMKSAWCCFIHAFLPFTFEKTASTEIQNLHTRMVTNREGEKARRKEAQTARKTA